LIVVCLLTLVCALPLRPVDAAEPMRYTLQQLLDSALKNNVDIAVARWKIAGADARLRKVRAARFLPRLRINSESGLVPEATFRYIRRGPSGPLQPH
jgi:outer membrane protein TolC